MTIIDNITLVIAHTAPLEWTLYKDGVALDITGSTITLSVDDLAEPATPSVTNQFTLAGVLTDAANGVVQFTMTTLQAALVAGDYFYDIKFVEAGGEVSHPIRGSWTVLESRTR